MMKNYGELTKKLRVLLCEAGKIMLSAHGVEAEGDIDDKSGTANFVTVFDVRVQEFLKAEILKILPDAYFIAEEQENDASSLDHDYCFIIDPIDGTTNFIHDYRHSSISLAMISHGETVFGAVYDPYMGELFHATKGEGCYVNDQRVSVSAHPLNKAVVAFGTCPYYKDTLMEKTFDFAKELFLSTADIRRCGSAALDLAYLAAGRNDVYFEFILSPWDYAAGELLVREAGGCVSDMRGNPLLLSEPCSVIASAGGLHEELLARLAKYM